MPGKINAGIAGAAILKLSSKPWSLAEEADDGPRVDGVEGSSTETFESIFTTLTLAGC
jgi:hypothetical protein